MQQCSKCGQPFTFYPTESGKQIPVNAGQDAAGNIIIENGVAVVMKKNDSRWYSVPKHERRKSHFATCAYAHDYRKRHPL